MRREARDTDRTPCWSKQRQTLVLRQFHVEGFVNTYRHCRSSGDPNRHTDSRDESLEDSNNAWKARETYQFLPDDGFVETFELAPPGQP